MSASGDNGRSAVRRAGQKAATSQRSGIPSRDFHYIEQQRLALQGIASKAVAGDINCWASAEHHARDFSGRCLTSLCFLTEELQQFIFENIVCEMRKIDANQYYYPMSDMHVTIRNIKPATVTKSFDAQCVDAQCIDDAIDRFDRLIPDKLRLTYYIGNLHMFGASIVLAAYKSSDFKNLERSLDRITSGRNLDGGEGYRPRPDTSAHITLSRLTQKPSFDLSEFVRSYKTKNLMRFSPRFIEIVECNRLCHAVTRRVYKRYPINLL